MRQVKLCSLGVRHPKVGDLRPRFIALPLRVLTYATDDFCDLVQAAPHPTGCRVRQHTVSNSW